MVGSIIAAVLHLFLHDSVFAPAVRLKWSGLSVHHQFNGLRSYTAELVGLIGGTLALVLAPMILRFWRHFRSWRAGISSVVMPVSAIATAAFLLCGSEQGREMAGAVGVVILCVFYAVEYDQQSSLPYTISSEDLKLNIPKPISLMRSSKTLNSGDDSIRHWNEDFIGRTAIVELLTDHALRLRTPIVALHGDFGDGETSVLNLLGESISGRAIVISFSAWLPGSEASFAIDLFRDIASECRKYVYVPQLRKRALGYARILSGSVPYLAGIREILPTQSQRQEIDDLRNALTRCSITDRRLIG